MGTVLLIFLTLILLIFLGAPIFLATLITSIIYMFVLDLPLSVAIIKIFGGICNAPRKMKKMCT